MSFQPQNVWERQWRHRFVKQQRHCCWVRHLHKLKGSFCGESAGVCAGVGRLSPHQMAPNPRWPAGNFTPACGFAAHLPSIGHRRPLKGLSPTLSSCQVVSPRIYFLNTFFLNIHKISHSHFASKHFKKKIPLQLGFSLCILEFLVRIRHF